MQPPNPQPGNAPGNHRIKIAVVVPKFGLVGGGEHFAAEITRRLAQNPRYEFHIFANDWVPEKGFIFHRVPYIVFPRFLRPLFFAWYVGRKIKRLGFDLVHTHHWIYQADIFSLHGIPHYRWVDRVHQRPMNWYDRAFDSVRHHALQDNPKAWFLPVSSLTLEEYRHSSATLSERWQVMNPGVALTRFSSPQRHHCREALVASHPKLAHSDLLLLFVGMNFELKGLDPIIAALALVKQQAPAQKIRLVVVGRGNQAKYQRLANQQGVGDDVVFTGPIKTRIEDIYRACDALLLLSTFDTFGMVVLEAMAAGLPALVSDHVGAKDLVVEGENGYVLEAPPRPDLVASRILSLQKPQQREHMAMRAQATAQLHDWSRLTAQMEELYERVLAEKSASLRA
jgi:UDP-glucose:(heptosyl)LPS alpha-1,3-glucosyltransferase